MIRSQTLSKKQRAKMARLRSCSLTWAFCYIYFQFAHNPAGYQPSAWPNASPQSELNESEMWWGIRSDSKARLQARHASCFVRPGSCWGVSNRTRTWRMSLMSLLTRFMNEAKNQARIKNNISLGRTIILLALFAQNYFGGKNTFWVDPLTQSVTSK